MTPREQTGRLLSRLTDKSALRLSQVILQLKPTTPNLILQLAVQLTLQLEVQPTFQLEVQLNKTASQKSNLQYPANHEYQKKITSA